jgi:hypothetical protein
MRHKAVIAGVEHRRIQKAVDNQRARLFVEFVFDRFAAERDLDDDVESSGGARPAEILAMSMAALSS